MMPLFFTTGPVLRVTDPCYSRDIWCTLTLGVTPGEYEARVDLRETARWGRRVHNLSAVHRDHVHTDPPLEWERCGEVGVDSGQLGFFCDSEYVGRPEDGDESWYFAICEATCSAAQSVALDRGVVSSAGYGDGTYPVYAARRGGAVVGVRVVFIGPEVCE